MDDDWIVPEGKLSPFFPYPDTPPEVDGNYQVRVVDLEHPAPEGRLIMARWGKMFGQPAFWETTISEGGKRKTSVRLGGVVEWRGIITRPRHPLFVERRRATLE